MKSAYLLAGIAPWQLIKMIVRNRGISLRPKYIFRLFFLLQSGIWTSLFSMLDKLRTRKAIKSKPFNGQIVIIVGHWRTGSTYLHQLMALDSENFVTPTVFQVSVPKGFITTEKYFKPVMSRAIPSKRPMDNVKLGFDEPQEDEYAWLKLGLESPLEKLLFPVSSNSNNESYFLSGKNSFEPSTLNLKKHWKVQLSAFCNRLSLTKPNKVVLLKNPFHTLRINTILELYPNVRFIHIVRNPIDVVPSTAHMWDIVGKENTLTAWHAKPALAEVALFYNKMVRKFHETIATKPSTMCAEVLYEELEQKPLETLHNIYSKLGLKLTEQAGDRINEFVEKQARYKKNKFNLSSVDRNSIIENTAYLQTKFMYSGA